MNLNLSEIYFTFLKLSMKFGRLLNINKATKKDGKEVDPSYSLQL